MPGKCGDDEFQQIGKLSSKNTQESKKQTFEFPYVQFKAKIMKQKKEICATYMTTIRYGALDKKWRN